jgi:hypothetical protein
MIDILGTRAWLTLLRRSAGTRVLSPFAQNPE